MRCGVTCARKDSGPMRAKYGCDGPATANGGKGWASRCWSCPEGERPRASCRWCQGTGAVAFTRCPGVMVTRDHLALVEAAEWARERGVLPVAGGRLDQSVLFLNGADIVDREDAACEARALKKRGGSED